MPITSLDHLVLSIADAMATRRFYVEGLGMRWVEFAPDRHALFFGAQKINLHLPDSDIDLVALRPVRGSADFCLLVDEPLADFQERLGGLGFTPVAGPMDQEGAVGPMRSLYFRDPDGNLVELARAED